MTFRCAPLPLFSYQEIPNYLRGNRFVVNGYRANLSASQCIMSIFRIHNETINIWSHLIGFFGFFLLMISDLAIILPDEKAGVGDYLIMVLTGVCFMVCMVLSALFHTFNCLSDKAYSAWLSMDVCGISIGAVGFYVSGLYYGFYCSHYLRWAYVGIALGLCVLVFTTQAYFAYTHSKNTFCRVLVFFFLGLYGIFPVVHWIVFEGGFYSKTVHNFFPKLVVMYLILMIAVVIYISKAPERCSPGKFDYCFQSHNLWHLMILSGFLWWHYSGIRFFKYRQENGCSAHN